MGNICRYVCCLGDCHFASVTNWPNFIKHRQTKTEHVESDQTSPNNKHSQPRHVRQTSVFICVCWRIFDWCAMWWFSRNIGNMCNGTFWCFVLHNQYLWVLSLLLSLLPSSSSSSFSIIMIIVDIIVIIIITMSLFWWGHSHALSSGTSVPSMLRGTETGNKGCHGVSESAAWL